MLDAWAATQGLELAPGTFNLCADRFMMIAHGRKHESLAEWGKLAPRWARENPGFSPRLYPVTLNGTVRAWLYRWAEPGEHLRYFAGDRPECRVGRYCEIVAETHIRTELVVADGDTVELRFEGEVA
jgi:hypothetical protein